MFVGGGIFTDLGYKGLLSMNSTTSDLKVNINTLQISRVVLYA